MLTLFLLIVGTGHLFGLANIYVHHRAADGDEQFTADDLKAVYTGVEKVQSPDKPPPPRMLEMIQTSMRKYLPTDAEYQALAAWLNAGAPSDAFDTVAPPAEKSVQTILSDRCLRCHNMEGEEHEKARKAPFGPDLFTVDLPMVHKFARVDPAHLQVKRTIGPQSTSRLILISHVHMMSIPVFTLITSLLMAMTRIRPVIRGPLVCLPMLALVMDFSGWWLARWAPVTVWMIAAAGPVYSLAFAGQILSVFGSLWFGRRGY